jgi:hypothetical protein
MAMAGPFQMLPTDATRPRTRFAGVAKRLTSKTPEPHFTTSRPLGMVACWNGPNPFPDVILVNVTVQDD